MTLVEWGGWLGACCLSIGGFLVALTIPCFLLWVLCSIWVAASNKFRNICKAESLIFEYRKNRAEFLRWIQERGDGKC